MVPHRQQPLDSTLSMWGQALVPYLVAVQAWGTAEAAAGNLVEANSRFQEAARLDSSSVPLWHAWAQAAEQQGKVDDARRRYLAALELEPRNKLVLGEPGALTFKAACCGGCPCCNAPSGDGVCRSLAWHGRWGTDGPSNASQEASLPGGD